MILVGAILAVYNRYVVARTEKLTPIFTFALALMFMGLLVAIIWPR